MNLESFNLLLSNLKDLKSKVDEQYEKSAQGGAEWHSEEVGREIVLPLLKALGFSDSDVPIRDDGIWVLAYKNKAIAIEQLGLGEKMEGGQLSSWINGTFIRLGILTDGNEFLFYTDSKISGKMDVDPYWSFKLTIVKDDDVKVLLAYCKDNLGATLENLPCIVWASRFSREIEKGQPVAFYESIAKTMEIEEPAYGRPSTEEAEKAFSALLSFRAPILSLSSNAGNLKGEAQNVSHIQRRRGNTLLTHPNGAGVQYSKTLASVGDLKNRKVRGYKFLDQETEYVRSFTEAFVNIVSILVNKYGLLADHPDVASSKWFCKPWEEEKIYWADWRKLKGSDWELNTTNSSDAKIRLLKEWLQLLNLPLTSLTLEIQ